MLGIYSLGSTWPLTMMQHHVAFEVAIKDVLTAPRKLRAAGVTAVGGRREPIDEPVVFSWMPAASIFFDDPDGNFLNTLRCSTTNRNQSLDCCCRGMNGSPAGKRRSEISKPDNSRRNHLLLNDSKNLGPMWVH
jgi:hypothetical protein